MGEEGVKALKPPNSSGCSCGGIWADGGFHVFVKLIFGFRRGVQGWRIIGADEVDGAVKSVETERGDRVFQIRVHQAQSIPSPAVGA